MQSASAHHKLDKLQSHMSHNDDCDGVDHYVVDVALKNRNTQFQTHKYDDATERITK